MLNILQEPNRVLFGLCHVVQGYAMTPGITQAGCLAEPSENGCWLAEAQYIVDCRQGVA